MCLDVAGLVQGATTEQRTVDTALDGAYLDGSYYELQRGTERAARLDWGAPAEDVQGALNALTLTDARVDIAPVGANPSFQPHDIIRSSCWTAPSARYRGASPSTTRPLRGPGAAGAGRRGRRRCRDARSTAAVFEENPHSFTGLSCPDASDFSAFFLTAPPSAAPKTDPPTRERCDDVVCWADLSIESLDCAVYVYPLQVLKADGADDDVTVSRSGPLTTGPDLTGGTQVGGYVWSITFSSDVWRDPTVEHPDDGDFDGNWVGSAADWDDAWSTGVSMEWGKNTGDMPSISCVDSGLYSSNGALSSDGVAESGGDGSSMEEMLEAMPNVGDITVARSAVNEGGNNGGFTWTVTFLRDAGSNGYGQFGDCEQRGTVDNLCNSPGDTDGVRGGLEWRVAFLENPGSYDGYTYPPGAGNLDSITYDTSNLQGTTPAVVNEVLRTGSTPFSGTFSVAFNGAKTEEMERQEATDEVEYVIEKLDTIGEIRVDRADMGLQRIPGVAATIGRDGSSASLVYDASFGDSYDRETSLMDYLAPGEVFRLGGVDGGIYSSRGQGRRPEMLGSLLDYSENAPGATISGTPPCDYVVSGLTNNTTVWKVETAGTGATNPIVDGTFELTLSVSGQSYTTDPIPYDAVGSAFDETGVYETLVASGAVSARTFQLTNDSSVVVASGSLAGILFDNDLIQVEGQRHEGEAYRVSLLDPSGTTFNLTSPATDEARIFLGTSKTAAKVTRVHGGRGTSATSEVFCEEETGYCSSGGRLDFSGSMESKLEALDELIDAGASRYGPTTRTASPGSFLDDSPASSTNDFALSLSANSLEDYNGTIGGAGASVTLTQWQAGETYSDCTGEYYVRVSAGNIQGYGTPQSTAPSSAAPYEESGAPSDVELGITSDSMLTIGHAYPPDGGDDDVSSYRDVDGSGWFYSGEPAYALSIGGVGNLSACAEWEHPCSTRRRSECLAWDAEEYEVDEQNDLFMSEFLDVADGVTGTRKTGVANAPSGYAYSLVGVSQPPTIYVDESNRSARPFSDDNDEHVVADVVSAGALLPLGSRDDATAAGQTTRRPRASSSVRTARPCPSTRSSSAFSVAFDGAGDQPAMLADGAYLAGGVVATVVDDVVQGSAATGIVLESLHAGMPRGVRVAARNELGSRVY
ncbi:RNA polymerase II transcription regulator recruiting protein [Aureococcus anophagefferens]|nr:RNA polymerase II transcription regulator recruiting protein [Aureococcus anophagefferens]